MGTTPSLPVRAGQALMEASRLLARPQEVRIESRYRRHRGVRECARGRCDRRDVDPMTRELLDFIMGRIESLPVMTPVTFRHEMAAPWGRSRTRDLGNTEPPGSVPSRSTGRSGGAPTRLARVEHSRFRSTIGSCCSQPTTESWVRIDLEQHVAGANHLASLRVSPDCVRLTGLRRGIEMGHDLPRTPLISGQWNRIFAVCGNRAHPGPSMSWRVALGASVMATFASVIILAATTLPAKAQFTALYGFGDSYADTGAAPGGAFQLAGTNCIYHPNCTIESLMPRPQLFAENHPPRSRRLHILHIKTGEARIARSVASN